MNQEAKTGAETSTAGKYLGLNLKRAGALFNGSLMIQATPSLVHSPRIDGLPHNNPMPASLSLAFCPVSEFKSHLCRALSLANGTASTSSSFLCLQGYIPTVLSVLGDPGGVLG